LALCSAREGEHGDVVVLAVVLRGESDGLGRLEAESRSAVESKKRAGFDAGFDPVSGKLPM
jgi:hypothetical protein